MNGNDTNTKGNEMNTTNWGAAAWADGIEAQIKELKIALKAALAGRDNDLNDPSELRAEIARLKRLLD